MSGCLSRMASGGQRLHFQAEPFCHRNHAPQLNHQIFAVGDIQRPLAAIAGGLSGFLLQMAVQFGGVGRQPRQVVSGAHTPDKPGGVPSRAAGQLLPLQQDDIANAGFRQMIGNRGADDSAADDDNL